MRFRDVDGQSYITNDFMPMVFRTPALFFRGSSRGKDGGTCGGGGDGTWVVACRLVFLDAG